MRNVRYPNRTMVFVCAGRLRDSPMAEIRFEHVWKRYGNVEAVKDLNLKCENGEFLALLGPSGCGKTSSLRMLAGLEVISEGDLYIGDNRVNDIPPKDRDISMVFEDYALYPQVIAAIGSVVILPILVLVFVVQKHIVRGLTMGAVKG